MDREEAINIVRKNIPHLGLGATEMTEALESLIPELAESEDEKVRKALIKIVKSIGVKVFEEEGVGKNNVLLYLERQKEQKPTAEEVLVKAGLKPYKDGNQWCILAGDNIQEGICGFGDTIDEALYQFLMEVLEMQKKPKSIPIPPPCWESAIQEQKPAEWREEDEKKIHFLSRLIEFQVKDGEYCFGDHTMITKQGAIDMLKSLRPSWKPSKEQMEALKEARVKMAEYFGYRETPILSNLKSLDEDIKKLM